MGKMRNLEKSNYKDLLRPMRKDKPTITTSENIQTNDMFACIKTIKLCFELLHRKRLSALEYH